METLGARRIMSPMDLRHVAIAVWAFSWLGMAAAYAASAAGGHLEVCLPHWSGCASISASGRYGAGYFIFKATMIPAGVFFAIYWMLCERWLRALGDTPAAWRRALLAAGLVGSAAFVLYATFLGSEGDPLYRALRRYGTVVFFGFTFVAQLLLVYRVRAVLGDSAGGAGADSGVGADTGVSADSGVGADIDVGALIGAKVVLCVFMLGAGLALEAFTYFVPDDAWLENLTEWHVAWALSCYPLLTWLMWRKSGFAVDFHRR